MEKQASDIATSIGTITVTVYTNSDKISGEDGVIYTVAVNNQSGNVMKVQHGNLLPYLTSAEIAQLLSFMARIRLLAIEKIL